MMMGGLCDVDSQEPKAAHLLNLSSTDVDRCVCVCVCLCLLISKMNNQHLNSVDLVYVVLVELG